ncbi:hypothetical protein ACFV4E_42485 [Streptomyces hygroscopicus]
MLSGCCEAGVFLVCFAQREGLFGGAEILAKALLKVAFLFAVEGGVDV